MINLVSVSGGKDSTATLLVAIERKVENLRAVFCDTGNEHPLTYDYVRYLEDFTGIEIKWLKADFADELRVRRDRLIAIANGAPDYVKRKVKYPWTKERAAAAAALLEPTGNPYLDLCLLKGMFPKRTVQFCTEELKVKPIVDYQIDLIDRYGDVESWQGVRADESPKRALLPEREDRGGGLTIYRPILRWNVEQVFEQHRKHGIKPNPLYKKGMSRVGCMPCINAGKNEILEISKRFPEVFERIAKWEAIVSGAGRSGYGATFFPYVGEAKDAMEKGSITAIVEWSKTQRGGRKLDMFRSLDDAPSCASAYGLCE